MPCVVFIGFLYTPTLSTTTVTSSWYLIWHFKLYPSTSTLIRPSGQSQGIQCLQLAFFSSAANLHSSLMTGDQSSYEGEPPSQGFSSSYDSEDWFNWNSTVYQWGAGRLTLYRQLIEFNSAGILHVTAARPSGNGKPDKGRLVIQAAVAGRPFLLVPSTWNLTVRSTYLRALTRPY